MKASSESGLCATVMVSDAITPGFYVAKRPLDLTCVPRKATMKSRVKNGCSCISGKDASRMKSPDGLRPTRRSFRAYDPSIVRQRQIEGDTPFHGGGKTSISPEGCQSAVGR